MQIRHEEVMSGIFSDQRRLTCIMRLRAENPPLGFGMLDSRGRRGRAGGRMVMTGAQHG